EGRVRVEFIADAPGVRAFPLSGRASTRPYPAVSLDTRRATLTRRRYPDAERETLRPTDFQFARLETGGGLDNQGSELAIVPSASHIYLPGGFETGWIYELIYEAQDPRVLGLGHVAVRDFISFLKHDRSDAGGTANPVREGTVGIEKAYGWGRSQSGRSIRDFLHLGFNEDVRGRRVFDGVLPHVAGAGLLLVEHPLGNVGTPSRPPQEGYL